MTPTEPLQCITVKNQIDLLLSDRLGEDVIATLNRHIARCDSCHTLFMSEMASNIFETQVEFRKSERAKKSQDSFALPKSFISAFPVAMKEIQFAMPLAASGEEKKMYKFVGDEYTITVWKIDKKGASETIIGLNIEDQVKEKYEGMPVEIISNDKQTVLLSGTVANGQVSDRAPFSFSEVEAMLPPTLLRPEELPT